MPRKRKPLPPLAQPTDLPTVGVQITLLTTAHGIVVDIEVRVLDELPGVEATIGRALREPAVACGHALAVALGAQMIGRDLLAPAHVAASRPGRS